MLKCYGMNYFSWRCPFCLFLSSLTYLKNWASMAENAIMNQTLHHGYCSPSGMLKSKNQVSWIGHFSSRRWEKLNKTIANWLGTKRSLELYVKIFMDLLSLAKCVELFRVHSNLTWLKMIPWTGTSFSWDCDSHVCVWRAALIRSVWWANGQRSCNYISIDKGYNVL